MNPRRVVAIIQARVGSTRLPRKVARLFSGKPMLAHEIERLKNAKRIDALIVATSDTPGDDVVENIAKAAGVEVFRGSENDVLDRYYHAAEQAKADIVVRVTGDCPLHDPAVVDEVIQHFLAADVDYALTPTNYPEGLDTEVLSFKALETVWKEAKLPSEREHVTPFINNHPERFKIDAPWTSGAADGRGMHWSVDTEQDFRFVETVYEHLHKDGQLFHMEDVLVLLKGQPELLEIHRGGTGFEGLEKSLKEDEEWKKNHA